MAVKAVVVTDNNGYEAIYLDGILSQQSDTLYAVDIALAVEWKVIELSHISVYNPNCEEYPEKLEDIIKLSESNELPATVDDLAMLVKRLVRQLPSDNDVAVKAIDYLRRKKMTGSILRNDS